MADDKAELSYEDAFNQLEEILNALENSDLPLEESLKLYEVGAQLAAYCTHKLDEAELRVRKWQPGDEAATLSSLEDWQES
ncbi:MAG: exodeoxyribonuclease VII small subunit [Litorilinea sp.]